jgi:hypothetical protein
MGYFALLCVIAALAYRLRLATRRADADARRRELENFILMTALRQGGHVTAVEIAARAPETVEEVETTLRELQRIGVCDSELTGDGRHVYIFRSFDDAPQRARTLEKNILWVAKACRAPVTPGDVALRTELSFDESRLWLDDMARRGLCRVVAPDRCEFFSPPDAPRDAEPPPNATGFTYDSDEKSRNDQSRLPQKSGGQ